VITQVSTRPGGERGGWRDKRERVVRLAHGKALRRGVAAGVSLATAGALAGLASTAGAAGAAPKPTMHQVQKMVNKLTAQENVAVQLYDQSAEQLTSAKQRLNLVNREVKADQAKFSAMREQIATIAATAFENGTMSSMGALLTSDNPQAVLNQASVLLQLSSDRSAQIKAFIATAAQLASAQQMARRTEQGIATLESQRLARKKSIGKTLDKQKAILATLTAAQQQQVTGSSLGAGGSTTATDPIATNTQAGKAVAYAYSKLGDPYVYGATGPGSFDCSGLVQAAWAAAGVSIPRTTYEQVAALPAVSTSALQPGDLLFFDGDGHVGIYVGGGYLIDAPQTGSNVEKVALAGWYRSNLDSAARP
jgi:cell wall-associated NlpC family hydrolase